VNWLGNGVTSGSVRCSPFHSADPVRQIFWMMSTYSVCSACDLPASTPKASKSFGK
jgi:hypothetical protein